jgi:hypothetical protein
MDVGRHCTADDVVAIIERLVAERGAPEHLRMDNGPELIAWALRDWCRMRPTPRPARSGSGAWPASAPCTERAPHDPRAEPRRSMSPNAGLVAPSRIVGVGRNAQRGRTPRTLRCATRRHATGWDGRTHLWPVAAGR